MLNTAGYPHKSEVFNFYLLLEQLFVDVRKHILCPEGYHNGISLFYLGRAQRGWGQKDEIMFVVGYD